MAVIDFDCGQFLVGYRVYRFSCRGGRIPANPWLPTVDVLGHCDVLLPAVYRVLVALHIYLEASACPLNDSPRNNMG